MDKGLHVSDIQKKIQQKMNEYEKGRRMSEKIRLDELNKLTRWILLGEEY